MQAPEVSLVLNCAGAIKVNKCAWPFCRQISAHALSKRQTTHLPGARRYHFLKTTRSGRSLAGLGLHEGGLGWFGVDFGKAKG